jgi:hypothetical protein
MSDVAVFEKVVFATTWQSFQIHDEAIRVWDALSASQTLIAS